MQLFSYPSIQSYDSGAQMTVSLRRFFWVPTTYVFAEEYEKYFFQLHKFIWRPD